MNEQEIDPLIKSEPDDYDDTLEEGAEIEIHINNIKQEHTNNHHHHQQQHNILLLRPIAPLNPTLKCKKCDFTTKNKKHFNKHQISETRCNKYPCSVCPASYHYHNQLNEHKTIHEETAESTQSAEKNGCKTCDKCSDTFPSDLSLKLHVIKMHAEYEMQTCPLCPFTCFLAESLQRHVQTHKDDEQLPKEKYDKLPIIESETSEEENIKEEFSCNFDQCTFVTQVKSQLKKHRIEVHPVPAREWFNCTKCNYRGLSENTLLEHMFKHTGEKAFKCNYCDERYESRRKLIFHEMRKHTKMGRHVCDRCGRRFVDQSTFKRHVMVHDEIRPFACDKCSFRSPSKYNLTKHLQLHERDGERRNFHPRSAKMPRLPRRNESTVRMRKSQPAPKSIREYSCTECEYKAIQPRLLKAHITFKHSDGEEKRHHCDDCDFRTSKQVYLTRHIKYMHKEVEMISCEQCDFKTKYSDSMIKHLEVHKEDKLVYKCHLCDYSAACSRAYRNHKLKHAGIKPYSCPDCPYRSVDLFRMRKHKIIHTGLKPFSCKVCTFRCADRTTLFRHAYTHGKPKPHGCDKCNFRSISLVGLVKHKSRVHQKKEEPDSAPEDDSLTTPLMDLNTLLE